MNHKTETIKDVSWWWGRPTVWEFDFVKFNELFASLDQALNHFMDLLEPNEKSFDTFQNQIDNVAKTPFIVEGMSTEDLKTTLNEYIASWRRFRWVLRSNKKKVNAKAKETIFTLSVNISRFVRYAEYCVDHLELPQQTLKDDDPMALCFGTPSILKTILKDFSTYSIHLGRLVCRKFDLWFRTYLLSTSYFKLSSFIRDSHCRIPFRLELLPPSISHVKIFGLEHVTYTGKFPSTVTHIYYNNYPLSIENLPPTLQSLKLAGDFNQPINNLPLSLTHLTLGDDFNQPLDNLPPSLTYLSLGYNFNQRVDNLPPSLKILAFGHNFSHPVDNLPKSLTKLDFSKSNFNLRIDNLPHSITHLFLGRQFNQPIDNLPPSLSHLSVGQNFNQPIDNLPKNIIRFYCLSHHFNHPIDLLPPSLIHLILGGRFNQPVDRLPPSLTDLTIFSLTFNHSVDHLPPTITHLSFGINFNSSVDHLPNSVISIHFGKRFRKSINNLPNSVEHLHIGNLFYFKKIKKYPSSLKYLFVDGRFNQFKRLPNSLTHLYLGESFNVALNHLPNSITQLVIGSKKFNQTLDHLPNSITHLKLRKNYSKNLNHLTSLQCLYIKYTDYLELGRLPDSLQALLLLTDRCPSHLGDLHIKSTVYVENNFITFRFTSNNIDKDESFGFFYYTTHEYIDFETW